MAHYSIEIYQKPGKPSSKTPKFLKCSRKLLLNLRNSEALAEDLIYNNISCLQATRMLKFKFLTVLNISQIFDQILWIVYFFLYFFKHFSDFIIVFLSYNYTSFYGDKMIFLNNCSDLVEVLTFNPEASNTGELVVKFSDSHQWRSQGEHAESPPPRNGMILL